jgi:hypothetical protein
MYPLPNRRNRRIIILASLIFILLSFLVLYLTYLFIQETQPEQSSSEAPQAFSASDYSYVRPTMFQGSTVELAWFYKPPSDGNIEVLSENFSRFVLTKNDESERDTLYAQGVNTPILRYLRIDAIQNPGDCTSQPLRNQIADRPGEFCEIRDNHPEWFMRTSSGALITGADGFVYMDPGNVEWRQYFLDRMAESQQLDGWFGIFFDNVEASLAKRERSGALPGDYLGEIAYQNAIAGFLEYLRINYFVPTGEPVYANIIELRDERVWFRYLESLDGAMSENWSVDWNDEYLSPERWLWHMNIAETTQAQGKHMLSVAQGQALDNKRQQFAFASYLLINWGNASFRYTNAGTYDSTWLYDNYRIPLGDPVGARYEQDGWWIREFANGYVGVNPETYQSVIETP